MRWTFVDKSMSLLFNMSSRLVKVAGKVAWYFHLLKNFPVYCLHTGKGFGIINKAEIHIYLELSCFFDDPADVGNLISGSSAFSKIQLERLEVCSSCTVEVWLGEFWSLQHVRWVQLCDSLSILLLGMKTGLSSSCGHCWVFQICWRIECSTFTASSFRIWNSSTGIPSAPLALFIMMLPQAHLTLHSRMSGSRWVIIPSWLSGSWRSFLYSSSVYSCHLFLISSAYVSSILFLSFIEPIFAWNVPLESLIFLKWSLVFPFLLFSSLHWSLERLSYLSLLFFGTLHSNGNIFPFLLCFSLLFFHSYF